METVTWTKHGTFGSCCASDLGWAPGKWPTIAAFDGGPCAFNREVFVYDRENELSHVVYTTQWNGKTYVVEVFND